MTCATSRARRPSHPVTGGDCRARTARTKASTSSPSASPSWPSRSSRVSDGCPLPSGSRRHTRTRRSSKSSEKYASGWKMRSLRSRLSETRLAVTLAMQPLAKRSRALAMSTDGVSTGTPTASIARTGDGTMLRIRSRSWIMRSSTTSTSVPRSPNVGEPLALDEAGLRQPAAECPHRGVEALEVPHLQDAPTPHRQLEQRLAVLDRRRERLLDQDVDACLEKVARHGVMLRRRHRDARAIDAALEGVMVGERRHAERLADGPRPRSIGVDDRRELNLGVGRVLLGV